MSDKAGKMSLPRRGVKWDSIMSSLKALKADDLDWRRGRLASLTYFYNDDLLEKQIAAYSEFIVENALGAGIAFKSIETMLSDVFSMAFGLFSAPSGAGASFTSGGTESLFEAVKTARNQARFKRGEPRGQYNIVAATTAHPTMDKAAEALDIEVRRTPLDVEYRGTANAFDAVIDDRTIMLFASAPCYPYGVFDRIEEIASLAQRRNIWLHVDACWGGFISPFAKELGYPIPLWDFQLSGVTSLSADLHKFGYAVKGASLIMFRDSEVQKHERFTFTNWARGTYSTPAMLGSQPAGSIASAWALMQYLGHEGYLGATRDTMDATMQLIAGINAIEGLKCLEPNGESNLFNFVSTNPDIDLNAVADILFARGWWRGVMREPLAIHQGVTPSHLPYVDEYLRELQQAVLQIRSGKLSGVSNELAKVSTKRESTHQTGYT
jgi:sphinganine-1-phosphate aldolase